MASISSMSLVSAINNASSNSSILYHRKLPKSHHIPRVACMSGNQNNSTPNTSKGDSSLPHRRNILLGLGGLCGAVTLNNKNNHFAIAAPVAGPDPKTCVQAELPAGAEPTNCCPPVSTKIIDFKFPTNQPLRVRPAAHLVNDEYLAKYKKAVGLMKNLPKDDPRSFTQQANVHCAYCDGGYHQAGFPDLDLEIHDCWLFFPYHRWYLYFHERILGSLINDPTFALPFWNWDSPEGMQLPSIYADPNSPLYDTLRNANHQPPTLVNLDFNVDDPDAEASVSTNLTLMYRQLVSNAKTPSLFFGSAYRAGDEPNPGGGSIENVPHGSVHE
ncbi:hypothetical protein VNO78_12916 [Psophocarpus tetragonolobus]|uniref:Tyrosinase copper-binding domain-containing protein n=1 Tax=Psophocarpus tetragonolobus TaxID=3891 RepID=A0AAN9SPQ9_PSOTE